MNYLLNPDFIRATLLAEIQLLPLMLLHVLALLGITSCLLLARGSGKFLDERSYILGLVLGTALCLMGLLGSPWFKAPIKIYLLTDFLFLAGFLGGWRNALVTFAFVLGTRALLGGLNNLGLAFVDMGAITVFSLGVRAFFQGKSLDAFGLKDIVAFILLRALAVQTGPLLVHFTGSMAPAHNSTLMLKRLFSSFTYSVFILYVLMLLLRKEKQMYKSSLPCPHCGQKL